MTGQPQHSGTALVHGRVAQGWHTPKSDCPDSFYHVVRSPGVLQPMGALCQLSACPPTAWLTYNSSWIASSSGRILLRFQTQCNVCQKIGMFLPV